MWDNCARGPSEGYMILLNLFFPIFLFIAKELPKSRIFMNSPLKLFRASNSMAVVQNP